MRAFFLACVVGALVAGAWAVGYHEDVGIPEAARLMKKEAAASRIVGGFPATSGDYFYMVGVLITLTTGQLSICGGTIMSTNRVLTAGRCWFDGYHQGRKMQITVGTSRLFVYPARDVASVAIHPQFDPYRPANDLAMLTLALYTGLTPPLLPSVQDIQKTFVGVSATVIGFGKTGDWSPIGPNQIRRSVTVPVIDRWDCYSDFGSVVTNDVICTRGANGWGACAGDTGGPLVIKNYANGSDLLIGVTSILSPLGCEHGFSTGYTRITSYLGWIQSNL